MAKDGTARGGARVGAGRKSKALNEKIVEGKAKKVLSFSEPAELNGEEMPPVKEYMKSRQKSGVPLCAEEVYRDTWLWLQERGCEKLVNAQLLTNYAMSVSRWIQCEECISEFGFLAKHPTTGNAIASPYVAMAQAYMKQVNSLWFQIFQIVKENCSSDYSGPNPQDDIMERLLSIRKDGTK